MLQQTKRRSFEKLATKEKNTKTFVIPDNIGGRYSVLTPVGLFTNSSSWNRYRRTYERCKICTGQIQ